MKTTGTVKFKEDYDAHEKNDVVSASAGFVELVVDILKIANHHPVQGPKPKEAKAESKG
jgi:hypothetical protein